MEDYTNIQIKTVVFIYVKLIYVNICKVYICTVLSSSLGWNYTF